MAEPVRHRQTKEAETDMFYLKPPRQISTLPKPEVAAGTGHFRFHLNSGRPQEWDECPFSASIVTGCQRKLHERPYCAVPSTAFTFTMKLLWIRICFIAGNCMTVWADVGPRMPTM
jgi:hypothetical protein